jgi:branched-chain amino acid transport system ATP-binding protein
VAEPILRVENIHVYYGLNHILFGISLSVKEGNVIALFGRNGMGKTTTLKTIMGILSPKAGHIFFRGSDITGLPPYVIANMGIGYVPEDRRIFPFLTVIENLKVAQKKGETNWTMERLFEIFPRLEGLKDRKGGHLSGGEQQMLTIARTLMGNPRLLLLDEPLEGLAPLVVRYLLERLVEVKKEGLVILLSEQNISTETTLVDRVFLIEKGEIRYEGDFQEFQNNQVVKRTYLGI